MGKLTQLKRSGVLTLAALTATAAAFAEEPSFQLDQVTVTATRLSEKLSDVPHDVTVITAEEIAQKGAKTLGQALQGVAGVTVTAHGGPGEKSFVYVLGTDKVVVMIDGRRMNLPQGAGAGSAGIDLSAILLSDNVERIEVVRGGGSALYGADAVGGVINIVTRKGAESKGAVSSGFGDYGAYRHSFAAEGSDQRLHWFINGLRESTNGQRDNSHMDGKNISLRLDLDLTDQETLSLNYDYYDSHAGMPGPLYRQTPYAIGDVLRRNWGVDYTYKRSEKEQRLIRVYQHSHIYSGEDNSDYATDPYNPENYDPFRHENDVTVLEYQDSAVTGAHTWTWGGEWRRDEVWSTIEGSVQREGTTTAGFIQNQLALSGNTALTTGLRHDHNSIYGSHWLPKLAILHKADEDTSLFANWGRVFKAPKFDDLYGGDGAYTIGNPDLNPEKGWTAEAGVKRRLSGASEAALSVFQRSITDAIKWQDDGSGVWRPVNIQEYMAQGVNATFVTQLSAHAAANVGYTYLDAKDHKTAEYTGEPYHSLQGGLTGYWGKLTVKLSGTYRGAAGLGDSRVPSYFTASAALNYAVSDHQHLFLHMSNIFDREYEAVDGYPAGGRSVMAGIKRIF